MRLKLILGAFLTILAGVCHADTPTPRMGLTLPATSQTGVWGAKLNRDFQIIDSSAAISTLQETITGPWVFTSSVAFSTFTVAQVKIGSTSYTGSEKLAVNGSSKFWGPTGGVISICDQNGTNCQNLTNSYGSDIRVGNFVTTENFWTGSNISFLGLGSGFSQGDGLESSMDCDGSCWNIHDTVSGSGGLFHEQNMSDIGNGSTSGQIIGSVYNGDVIHSTHTLSGGPINWPSYMGMNGHVINTTFKNFTVSGATTTALYVAPISTMTASDLVQGISVDMNGVTNPNAIRVAGRMTGGPFIVEGSSKSAYSLIVSTDQYPSYQAGIPSETTQPFHLSVSTSGTTILGGPLRYKSKTKTQIQTISSPAPLPGDSYYCSNCVRDSVCTSTGGINSFVAISSRTQACN